MDFRAFMLQKHEEETYRSIVTSVDNAPNETFAGHPVSSAPCVDDGFGAGQIRMRSTRQELRGVEIPCIVVEKRRRVLWASGLKLKTSG